MRRGMLGRLSLFVGLGSSGSSFRIDSRLDRFGGSAGASCGAGGADAARGAGSGRLCSFFGGDAIGGVRPSIEEGKGVGPKGLKVVGPGAGREKGD